MRMLMSENLKLSFHSTFNNTSKNFNNIQIFLDQSIWPWFVLHHHHHHHHFTLFHAYLPFSVLCDYWFATFEEKWTFQQINFTLQYLKNIESFWRKSSWHWVDMTTRKRVGGGFKIVHPKVLSPGTKAISTEVENLKEHHSNSEKETRKDDIVTSEHIDLDIKSDGDDSSDHRSVELPEINETSQKRHISKKDGKHKKETLELPFISPDKSSLVTNSDKFSSLVTSREDTEKTDSTTEKLKVCLKLYGTVLSCVSW